MLKTANGSLKTLIHTITIVIFISACICRHGDPIAARLKDSDDDFDYDFDDDNDIEHFDLSERKDVPGRAAVVKKNRKETVMIGTEKELLAFMDRVNRGEPVVIQ